MEKLDLKSVIKQYPDCTLDRKKLRATLLDYYPQKDHRREINVILAVYDSGVLAKFQGKDSLTTFETAALCTQIENDYGIHSEYIVEGIIAWGEAKDVKISAVVPPKPSAAPASAAVPKPALSIPSKPIAPVRSLASEYAIEEREEGWFITKFQGFEQEHMTIPNLIGWNHIIGIGEGVFQGFKGIKAVTISEGIRFLDAEAFKQCSLNQITLPSTLEIIGASCFEKSGLKSVTVPEGATTIRSKAFYDCHRLEAVKLPDTITQIGKDSLDIQKLKL